MMNKDKMPNNSPSAVTEISKSLVSFLLCELKIDQLTAALESIFNQREISSFEVVICDDASTDGAWRLASEYALRYEGTITISRNAICLGSAKNRQKGKLLCRGIYTVEISGDQPILFPYILECIASLQRDSNLNHLYIEKTSDTNHFIPLLNYHDSSLQSGKTRHPLVDIHIYNYNYGRFLKQCLDSVFSQTYHNIQVCFSDNASNDNSWSIVMEYSEKYPGRISLTRNRINLGPATNLWNCDLNRQGKYFLKLCSDDAIKPEFIEKCVSALENHPNAAFAMTHRDIMDENGQITSEPPFYNQSCLIPGDGQAAVYMMSAINPSVSQILYSVSKAEGKRMIGNLNDRWHGDRLMDFHLCAEYDVVYINDALLINRVHPNSDGSAIDQNLLQCFTQYVLAHQFSDIASNHGHMSQTVKRLPEALNKIGALCLRYCLRFLITGDQTCAKRYFYLAQAISPEISKNEQFILLEQYWDNNETDKESILNKIAQLPNLAARSISYPPPQGSKSI